jgi:hypothetical protein
MVYEEERDLQVDSAALQKTRRRVYFDMEELGVLKFMGVFSEPLIKLYASFIATNKPLCSA